MIGKRSNRAVGELGRLLHFSVIYLNKQDANADSEIEVTAGTKKYTGGGELRRA